MAPRDKIRRIALSIPFVLLGLWAMVRLLFGGGDDYNFSLPPLIDDDIVLEEYITMDEPFGNVAISNDGRLFFSIHPESGSQDKKLMEWKNDSAVAYPSLQNQSDSFNTVLGIHVDQLQRLWVLDYGNHGIKKASVRAYQLNNDSLVYHHEFPKAMAPTGSMLNDIRVSKDGRFLFITDASIIAGSPALLVHDTEEKQSRRRLEEHETVEAQNLRIRTKNGDLSYFGSTITIQPGVDGIALDPDGDYIYYSSMCHDELYRIPTKSLSNFYLSDEQLEDKIELVAKKPLSDGMCTDDEGNLYITAIEEGAILKWNQEDSLKTLIQAPDQIRWPDGLCFNSGYLYITDSALPQLVLKNRGAVKKSSPYSLFRVKIDAD